MKIDTDKGHGLYSLLKEAEPRMGCERPNQAPIQGHRHAPGLTRAVRKQAKA